MRSERFRPRIGSGMSVGGVFALTPALSPRRGGMLVAAHACLSTSTYPCKPLEGEGAGLGVLVGVVFFWLVGVVG